MLLSQNKLKFVISELWLFWILQFDKIETNFQLDLDMNPRTNDKLILIYGQKETHPSSLKQQNHTLFENNMQG